MMPYHCEVCNLEINLKHSYYKHLRCSHPEINIEQKYDNFICYDKACPISFRFLRSYIKHLKKAHNTPLDYSEHRFKNLDEFYKWKSKTELDTVSKYINLFKRNNSLIFTCNRNGKFVQKANRVRKMRAKGSRKTTKSCPSSMYVKILESDGTVHVDYYGKHLDHELDWQYIGFTESDAILMRDELIAANLDIKAVLKKYEHVTQLSADGIGSKLCCINKKALENVILKFNLKPVVEIIEPKKVSLADIDKIFREHSYFKKVPLDSKEYVAPETNDVDDNCKLIGQTKRNSNSMNVDSDSDSVIFDGGIVDNSVGEFASCDSFQNNENENVNENNVVMKNESECFTNSAGFENNYGFEPNDIFAIDVEKDESSMQLSQLLTNVCTSLEKIDLGKLKPEQNQILIQSLSKFHMDILSFIEENENDNGLVMS